MKSTKKILLPEKNAVIIEAIQHFCSLSGIEIINEIEIQPAWFINENLDLANYDINQQILINSFLALKNHAIDGLIVGSDYSSKDVFKWTLKLLNPDKQILSSCFVVQDQHNMSIWGDCAFNIEPTLKVAQKNIEDMILMAQKLNLEPVNVKLLSYSTNDSGTGSQISFIKELSDNLKQKYFHQTKINISDNVQFDAAFDEIIATKKKIEFQPPKVVWFPNLMSGNIGYKIAQYYGKLIFAGPFILGLNYLVSDLSRGASVNDVVLTIKTMLKML